MRPPEAFDLMSVDLLGAGPAFGRAQNDHGPLRPLDRLPLGCVACFLLNGADVEHAALHDFGHFGVHRLRVIAFHNVRRPSQTPRRACPAPRAVCGQGWSGLAILYPFKCRMGSTAPSRTGFRNLLECQLVASGPVSDSPSPDRDGHDQVGIVERRPKAMGKAVAEFAALVNRSRSLRSAMAADASRKRKLLQELVHPVDILALIRVDLRIHPFEIAVGERRRGSMPGTRDVDHVEVVLLDQPVHMDPDKALAGIGSPMPQQAVLDVLGLQRLTQQRVRAQVQHAGGKIVAGAPVGIHFSDFIGGQRLEMSSLG